MPQAAGRTADDPPVEIASGVFCVGPHGRTQTNVYIVRDGPSWALVDAGWSGDTDRILAAARSVVGSATAPVAILVTHVHPDHSGSAKTLAGLWGCPVLVHDAELPIASGDFDAMARYAGPLDRWVILPTMRVIGRRRRETILARGSLAGVIDPLDPDGSIPGLPSWGWVGTPGHTPGHVAFVRPDDRVVITGDALVTLRVNELGGILRGRQGLSAPPRYTTWDAAAADDSIAAIADLEPTVIAAGHGRPITGPGTAAAVRAFAAGLTPRAT